MKTSWPYLGVRNNRRPSAICHAFQLHDQPNTYLSGRDGHPEALLIVIFDWLTCHVLDNQLMHVWRLFPHLSTNGHPILCNDQSNHAMSGHLSLHFKFLISDSASIFVAMHVNCTRRYRFLLQTSDMIAYMYLSLLMIKVHVNQYCHRHNNIQL